MKLPSLTWESAVPQAAAVEGVQSVALPMDHDEFAAFYERTSRPLWAYLARVSGNATLAEDLVQESYVRFLGAQLPEGDVARRRYLFRIGTNLLRDHWRRPSATALDDVPEIALAPAQNRACEQMDSVALLGPALERMRPRDRQLLWLAYAEGATHREIGEILGVGHASVRLMLFRARRKLARLLRQGSPRRSEA